MFWPPLERVDFQKKKLCSLTVHKINIRAFPSSRKSACMHTILKVMLSYMKFCLLVYQSTCFFGTWEGGSFYGWAHIQYTWDGEAFKAKNLYFKNVLFLYVFNNFVGNTGCRYSSPSSRILKIWDLGVSWTSFRIYRLLRLFPRDCNRSSQAGGELSRTHVGKRKKRDLDLERGKNRLTFFFLGKGEFRTDRRGNVQPTFF